MNEVNKVIGTTKVNAYIDALIKKVNAEVWENETKYIFSRFTHKPFIASTFEKWTPLASNFYNYRHIEVTLYEDFVLVELTTKINGKRKSSTWRYSILDA
jgi:hypothetical protein